MSYDFIYGMELELCDIDRRKGIPTGFTGFSDQEYDLVCSQGKFKGLPNDPTASAVYLSGELNSKPTLGYEGQLEAMKNALNLYPEATINHRIDLHLHISLPEFKTDLVLLKKLVTYFYLNTEAWLKYVYPKVNRHNGMTRGDHQFQNINSKLMPKWRYDQIMSSHTIEEFLRNHQTDTTGKYNARMTTRYPFNMFSVRDHGSIECRGFWPTLDINMVGIYYKLLTTVIEQALSNRPIPLDELLPELYKDMPWNTKTINYDHFIQCAWRYSSYPNVGKMYMVPRWLEFKKLWEESNSAFFEEGWYNKSEFKFNSNNYTPMTLNQAIEEGLV